MAPGGPEHLPGWFMMLMGGAGQPTNDLDLRFLMILAHLSILRFEPMFSHVSAPMSLSLGACAVKRSHGIIYVPL